MDCWGNDRWRSDLSVRSLFSCLKNVYQKLLDEQKKNEGSRVALVTLED